MSKQRKILFVDDDHEDQEIFGAVLSEVDASIGCSFADTAEDALQTLSKGEENPDYIFLDLNLPLMSGWDCLHVLKGKPQFQNIPVIIFSTSSRDTDKQKAKELGAISYISKPNTVVELKNLLQGIFI